ncbi:hypothetical protein PVAG01_08229 [Phlyctema vagabunda]|uniref:Uncharacterized protein n=1 Tax=Phlyctema vagabunda TaxID=108571 RepID=A0ABR4P8U8_9HELO
MNMDIDTDPDVDFDDFFDPASKIEQVAEGAHIKEEEEKAMEEDISQIASIPDTTSDSNPFGPGPVGLAGFTYYDDFHGPDDKLDLEVNKTSKTPRLPPYPSGVELTQEGIRNVTTFDHLGPDGRAPIYTAEQLRHTPWIKRRFFPPAFEWEDQKPAHAAYLSLHAEYEKEKARRVRAEKAAMQGYPLTQKLTVSRDVLRQQKAALEHESQNVRAAPGVVYQWKQGPISRYEEYVGRTTSHQRASILEARTTELENERKRTKELQQTLNEFEEKKSYSYTTVKELQVRLEILSVRDPKPLLEAALRDKELLSRERDEALALIQAQKEEVREHPEFNALSKERDQLRLDIETLSFEQETAIFDCRKAILARDEVVKENEELRSELAKIKAYGGTTHHGSSSPARVIIQPRSWTTDKENSATITELQLTVQKKTEEALHAREKIVTLESALADLRAELPLARKEGLRLAQLSPEDLSELQSYEKLSLFARSTAGLVVQSILREERDNLRVRIAVLEQGLGSDDIEKLWLQNLHAMAIHLSKYEDLVEHLVNRVNLLEQLTEHRLFQVYVTELEHHAQSDEPIEIREFDRVSESSLDWLEQVPGKIALATGSTCEEKCKKLKKDLHVQETITASLLAKWAADRKKLGRQEQSLMLTRLQLSRVEVERDTAETGLEKMKKQVEEMNKDFRPSIEYQDKQTLSVHLNNRVLKSRLNLERKTNGIRVREYNQKVNIANIDRASVVDLENQVDILKAEVARLEQENYQVVDLATIKTLRIQLKQFTEAHMNAQAAGDQQSGGRSQNRESTTSATRDSSRLILPPILNEDSPTVDDQAILNRVDDLDRQRQATLRPQWRTRGILSPNTTLSFDEIGAKHIFDISQARLRWLEAVREKDWAEGERRAALSRTGAPTSGEENQLRVLEKYLDLCLRRVDTARGHLDLEAQRQRRFVERGPIDEPMQEQPQIDTQEQGPSEHDTLKGGPLPDQGEANESLASERNKLLTEVAALKRDVADTLQEKERVTNDVTQLHARLRFLGGHSFQATSTAGSFAEEGSNPANAIGNNNQAVADGNQGSGGQETVATGNQGTASGGSQGSNQTARRRRTFPSDKYYATGPTGTLFIPSPIGEALSRRRALLASVPGSDQSDGSASPVSNQEDGYYYHVYERIVSPPSSPINAPPRHTKRMYETSSSSSSNSDSSSSASSGSPGYLEAPASKRLKLVKRTTNDTPAAKGKKTLGDGAKTKTTATYAGTRVKAARIEAAGTKTAGTKQPEPSIASIKASKPQKATTKDVALGKTTGAGTKPPTTAGGVAPSRGPSGRAGTKKKRQRPGRARRKRRREYEDDDDDLQSLFGYSDSGSSERYFEPDSSLDSNDW